MPPLNAIESGGLGVTLVSFLILLLYYLRLYGRLVRKSETEESARGEQPSISILLYAHDDAERLSRNLPLLFQQDYPRFQVIVIIDNPENDTEDILSAFRQRHDNLYHTYIPAEARYLSRRKLAFTLGAKAAHYDTLLFTETNCHPTSDRWLAEIAAAYRPQTQIVLGFCRYGDYPGLFQKLVAYDNLLEGARCLSAALAHHPYAGDGRNLSYRKSLFFQQKGYYRSLNLVAGDDDLFVNESATAENTRIVRTTDSQTEMEPIDQAAAWIGSKVTRVATKRHYKGRELWIFRMENAVFFLFQLSALGTIAAGCFGNWIVAAVAGAIYALRFLAKAIVFHRLGRTLGQRMGAGWLFPLEFIQPLIEVYVRLLHHFRHEKDYTFTVES